MRNLLLFIWKHYFFFVFLLLEGFCLYLVVQNNYYQHATFVNSSNKLSANVLETSRGVKDYFYLKDVNEGLAQENAELRSRLLESYSLVVNDKHVMNDTSLHQKYTYTSAKVVNNSTNRRNNFLTLDKGSKHGITKDMAVITNTGIVGQVKDISENFCTVMSMLHSRTIVSAKIKKDGSYGPLTWDGANFEYVTLSDIPTHVRLVKGDTIVTSAYSLTFPENIKIGVVDSWERKSGEYFYTVRVRLLTDFKKLTHVYIVNNMMKNEQEQLETKSEADSKE
ncbi:MAG: rod shape-determining protein MreC [Bacteroidota bacterium]|jgi:rod shape-determining protein MreC|nr:rod shape-determining protein MreC [Bacteroidota bacterium]